MICKICNNTTDNKEFKIKEMIFGLGETFDYFECSKCGCLQIVSIPENMEKYYPNKDYYSFKNPKFNYIKQIIRKKRNEYIFNKKGFIGKTISEKYPNYYLEIISGLRLNERSKILDVGSGSGYLVKSLSELGFNNVIGIDPYIDEDISDKNYKILKKTIHEINDDIKFDLIIFSHSLEHMRDQSEILLKATKLLSKNGTFIIGMPVKNEYIWDLYGINWIQIDAPRHFLIHTETSFNILLKKLDLYIKEVIYNSNEFQFWGSEQVIRKIPLNSNKSYYLNPGKSSFTDNQIKEFKKRSNELNKKNLGDQAIFIIKKLKI
jgi:2-polyprenyl-3-methyl-5-hydroxy-6-metoxy-1,4-benzoquinol methylase